jgi:diguanylate cyclase (GGDEF)-like protein
MPDITKSERSWRFDRVPAHTEASPRNQEGQPPPRALFGATVARSGGDQASSAAVPLPLRSRGVFASWLRALLARRVGGAQPAFEEVVHQFAAIIETEVDPVIVESSLLGYVRQLAPSTWVELVAGTSAAPGDQGATDVDGAECDRDGTMPKGTSVCNRQPVLEIPLRSGRSASGRLRIRARVGGCLPDRDDVIRQMTTLCTMAACALESLGRQPESSEADDGVPSDWDSARSIGTVAPSGRPARASLLFHDATFLNAVLPFALNQAKRHRESLSLLCVAIDRLSSINDLLGRGEVDRLVQHVGQTVATLIRASDIVARLDDDRIVAVLPRAPRGGALHVAKNICRSVASERPVGCVSSSVTVSIGVATFPSCAANVYSLFDAADEALGWAQKQGRDRAVLAPPQESAAQAETSGCTT